MNHIEKIAIAIRIRKAVVIGSGIMGDGGAAAEVMARNPRPKWKAA